MTPSARRSLTDPIGLNASILTYSFTCAGASLLILTTGVWPIVSRMLSNLFLQRSMGWLPLQRLATSLHYASLLVATRGPCGRGRTIAFVVSALSGKPGLGPAPWPDSAVGF